MIVYHGSYCLVQNPNISFSREALDFILQCRGRSTCYLDYDIVIGGIADDRVYNTIELYQDKLIDKAEALNRLQFYKPNHQIYIINQDIINKYLIYENCEEV